MEIRVRVPRVPSGIASNLVGLFGLVAVVLAIGGLSGNWWWSVLTGGVFAVGLTVLAQAQAPAQEQASPATAGAPTQPLPRIAAVS